MTKAEARCYYNAPQNCDEESLSSLSEADLSECFENSVKTECTSWVYSDPNFNETLVKEYDLVCSKGNVPKMFILLFNVGMTLGTVFNELFSVMFEIQFLFILQTNKVRSLLENFQTNLDEQKV